jgi:hypothetical protein
MIAILFVGVIIATLFVVGAAAHVSPEWTPDGWTWVD